jgi:hypothetical protein
MCIRDSRYFSVPASAVKSADCTSLVRSSFF